MSLFYQIYSKKLESLIKRNILVFSCVLLLLDVILFYFFFEKRVLLLLFPTIKKETIQRRVFLFTIRGEMIQQRCFFFFSRKTRLLCERFSGIILSWHALWFVDEENYISDNVILKYAREDPFEP